MSDRANSPADPAPGVSRAPARPAPTRLRIGPLLRPYWRPLALALVAVIGETLGDILEPWPVKIVVDNVLLSKPLAGAWAAFVVHRLGGDRFAILNLALAAVIVIAVVGAVSSYAEKYLTTSVGQWVSHDLRLLLYQRIQRLSLIEHGESRTGDLISRVTSDIDAVQDFINSALLGILVSLLTLAGMIGVMFYINWRFTLIALSVAPVLFAVVYFYTRRLKKASRALRKKEGEITSVVEEVLSSIRVVKAFAREDYEVKRLEEESLEGVEVALRARGLKAKLTPIVNLIVATGTCLVLWFGARLVLSGSLSAGEMVVFILYLGKM